MTATCRWCRAQFPARKRGDRRQEFCSPDHRIAYWRAAQAFGDTLAREGRVNLRQWWERHTGELL